MLEVTGIPPILLSFSPMSQPWPVSHSECERVNNTPLSRKLPKKAAWAPAKRTTEPQPVNVQWTDDENVSRSERSSQLKAAPPSVMAADSQRPSVWREGRALKTLLLSDNKDPPIGSGHRTDRTFCHFRTEHRKEDCCVTSKNWAAETHLYTCAMHMLRACNKRGNQKLPLTGPN